LKGLKFILILTASIGLNNIVASQGDTIIVNKYASVVELFNNNSNDFIDSLRISINDTINFNEGDTVVIHQAQGVEWTYNYHGHGDVKKYKAAGWFEYRIIANRIKDTIVFHGNLDSLGGFKYDVRFGVQLIKVKTAKKLVVPKTKTLSAPGWNGDFGGILAIIADTLELDGNIDVTGKGFRGADPGTIKSKVTCSDDTFRYISRNYSLYEIDSSGLKGESLVVFDTSYMRGKECLYNGGGGGNGRFSGGGGGSNYGMGGNGGPEEYNCIPDHDYAKRNKKVSGQGGLSLTIAILKDRDIIAVFGGGGGCSTQDSACNASTGGNGGGIILLIVNVLKANNENIIVAANGGSVSTSSLAGGGGGGGGGAILMDINKCIGYPTFEVKGGSGGNTLDTKVDNINDTVSSGPGGGGGGGYIIHNKNFNTNEAIFIEDPGEKGHSKIIDSYELMSGDELVTSGDYGGIKDSLVMPVNDFLFNIVPWKMQICYGETPDTFKASRPKGGSGDYSYIWFRSSDLVHWDSVANTMEYKETTTLYDTTFYKRNVYSYNIKENKTIIDSTSGITTVIVHSKILKDSIYSKIHEVCQGVALPLIHSLYPKPAGGTGFYTYQWEDSVLKWTNAPGDSKKLEYLPPHTDTVHLRRVVRSGACFSNSNIITVNVLPSIDSNKIFKNQWIIDGKKPLPITGLTPENGNGTYNYKWQQRKNKESWVTATGISDTIDYSTPLIPDTTYYIRIVYSGQDSTCRDTSAVLSIYILKPLKNNQITGNDTICGHTSPAGFNGTQFSGGDNKVYIYKWEKSRDSVHWEFSDSIKILDYNPGLLDSSFYFRRIIISGPTDCIKDTSKTIFVLVKPQIKNNIIDKIYKDTVCSGQSPGIIKAYDLSGGEGAGSYLYTWQVSNNNINFDPATGINNQKDYNSVDLTEDSYLRRDVKSGDYCISYSDTIKITALVKITNNEISPDQLICTRSVPSLLVGTHPANGDKINYRFTWLMSTDNLTWTDTIANNTDTSYQPSAVLEESYFKRVVTSGPEYCCKDTSKIISVKIHDLPTAVLSSFADSICLNESIKIPIKFTGKEDYELTYLSNTDTNTVSNITLNNGWYDLTTVPVDTGIFNYSIIKVKDGNNCVAKDILGNVVLTVFERPVARVGADASVCRQETLLTAVPSVGSGIWTSDNYAVFTDSSAPSTKVRIDDFTNEDFKLRKFIWTETHGVCSDTASTRIIFYQQPKKPNAGSDTAASFLFSTNLNAAKPSVGKAVWTTPDNSILIEDSLNPATLVSNLKMDSNKFIWTVYNNICDTLSDEVIIRVLNIRIPQGFSPNGDKVNDYFEIKGLEKVSNANLTIFNVAGVEVFHSSNYNNKWFGTRNGNALPDDTYFYILNVIGRTYKGFITIRR
jgi:gliding motility-associated-like protein